jgi:TetR/AcrR family tetracycline transcriptional repressor
VGRPTVPLISRKRVAEVALELVDRDGIEALNVRALGKALGVNGASLYHHYQGKDEILEDVAKLVLSEVDFPGGTSDWKDNEVQIGLAYRAALLAHPNIVPLMLQQHPWPSRVVAYSQLLNRMADDGVPTKDLLWVLQAIEGFVIGAVLMSLAESDIANLLAQDTDRDNGRVIQESIRARQGADPLDQFSVTFRRFLDVLVPDKPVRARRSQKHAGRPPTKRANKV